MLPSKHISTIITAFIALLMMTSVKSLAQTTAAPDAVYYVCAEQGFKLSGPAGYDHYSWKEDDNGMPGADSSNIQVPALTAAVVGNSYVTKTYHLRVQNAGTCWSEEATYVVYILPKMELSLSGYMPPYCENLSHDITLTAHINGGSGSTALTLPAGVSVQYSWTVEPNFSITGGNGNSNWNAAIAGPTDQATAQVLTPGTSSTDNNYTLKISYSYPASANISTDVVGDCGDSYTQNVHADPAPQIPTINYQLL